MGRQNRLVMAGDEKGLMDAFSDIFADYQIELDDAVRSDVAEVGESCAKSLKKTSPYRKAVGKHYRNGWVADVTQYEVGGWKCVVHNKTKPGLTHLLEHGHGGPHPAPPHPHIEAAANDAAKDIEGRMRP